MPLQKRVSQHLDTMAHTTPPSARSVLQKAMNAYFCFYLAYKTAFRQNIHLGISLRRLFLGKADLAALAAPVTSLINGS